LKVIKLKVHQPVLMLTHRVLEDAQLPLASMEEQAAIEGNPTKLKTLTYLPVNAVMYNVAGAELTAEEKIELASKNKVMNPTPTQLYENPFKDPASSSSQNMKFFKGLPGRVDISEEIGPPTTRVRGHDFVSTPTPHPYAAGSESPMI